MSSGSFIYDLSHLERTLAINADGSINLVAAAGSAVIGKVGIDQTTPGSTNGIVLTNTLGMACGSPSYIAIATGYSAYATPTDMVRISGSATKTVAVTGMAMTIQSTAAAVQNLSYIKRSAANTGGTPTNLTAIPYDTNDPAATAVASTYAAAPSPLGASIGTIAVSQTTSAAVTSAGISNSLGTSIGIPGLTNFQKPVILRGVAEGLCINYGGAALTAGFVANVFVQWIEF